MKRATIGALFFVAGVAIAQAQALSGVVTSQAEGAMEGVIIGAKRAGSSMTVSVVSDKQGRYSFPAERLEPGNYTLRVRATGYMLESANAIAIGAQKNVVSDLRLRKASVDETASQLSNSEWLMSGPVPASRKIPSAAAITVTPTSASCVRNSRPTRRWQPLSVCRVIRRPPSRI
ncbi:MAG: carboxypeptidase-like regulatory domain-containing protein [bacterium]